MNHKNLMCTIFDSLTGHEQEHIAADDHPARHQTNEHLKRNFWISSDSRKILNNWISVEICQKIINFDAIFAFFFWIFFNIFPVQNHPDAGSGCIFRVRDHMTKADLINTKSNILSSNFYIFDDFRVYMQEFL